MRVVRFPLFGLVSAALLAASPVAAATLTADEIMGQFNLVVFGNHSLNSQVHGRAFVGGDLVGNSGSMTTSNYTLPPSSFADVTVAGDIRSGDVNTKGGASVQVGGAIVAPSKVNNAGSVQVGVAGLDAVAASFEETLKKASQDIRAQSANASLSNFNGTQGWQAVGLAGQQTVLSIAASDLNRNELNIDLNGALSILINVSGSSVNLAKNFNTPVGIGSNVIWNFYEATSLTLSNRWVGSVLAPLAAVTNGNNIHGTLVAASFTQGGQVHQQSWAGKIPTPEVVPPAVPLPAAGWLLLAGVAGLAALRRRRAA
ncbi:choice-of-anchor A family protein [Pseudorhodobacter sp. MZDSW-24AT]|uniref:choice-of-anchor A family protein n=1 Tax=Pseudorhodobacter sp. MZDSW-24AT TaxID=2052957 RepID=UPI000C1E6B47|nr:choice-of-anchor A family protein [Pseudorhodobacter sp. MZDSW-24AT]PJF10399.1 hypothetical protein CUR21_04860 [Pseudorhodobacter sp. MZDSW-24AT]